MRPSLDVFIETRDTLMGFYYHLWYDRKEWLHMPLLVLFTNHNLPSTELLTDTAFTRKISLSSCQFAVSKIVGHYRLVSKFFIWDSKSRLKYVSIKMCSSLNVFFDFQIHFSFSRLSVYSVGYFDYCCDPSLTRSNVRMYVLCLPIQGHNHSWRTKQGTRRDSHGGRRNMRILISQKIRKQAEDHKCTL